MESIVVESPIIETPRVAQIRGMFDMPRESTSRMSWRVHLPLDERDWNIGLIAGPSGCGKTTIARHVFGTLSEFGIDGDRCVVDAFPKTTSIREIVSLLSAVGFSSPPAWLRPFRVLSTGQQFRAALALQLAATERDKCIVCDEYASVVDRTVAQVASAALAKTVRRRGQQFVAVTCHEDVEAWLQPDWVLRPAEELFRWRRLRRRPGIALDIVRCKTSAWKLFAPHHYLSHALARSAVCFLASWQNQPVAFSAWLPYFGNGPKGWREHRTVTLPDFQGTGIGNALSDFVASLWSGLGYRALSTTTHPAMTRSRLRSRNWRLKRAPSFASRRDPKVHHATMRLTAGFEYIGPPLPPNMGTSMMK